MITKLDVLGIQVNVNAKTCDDNYKANDFAQDQLNDRLKTLVEEMDK